VVIILLSNFATAQWTHLNSGVQVQLRSIYFADQNTGWSCGFNTILKTTNAGNSWQSSNVTGSHKSMAFVNSTTGFVCGENGRVYKTMNGGESWQLLNSGVSTTLNNISIAPDGSIIIPGNQTTVLRSSDGGITWTDILNIPAVLDFFAVKILNSSTFVVSGNESTILRTTNTGTTWESISIGMPNPLFAIDFTAENTGWVTGCCGMFMKTTNAGISWTTDDYLTPGYTLYSMQFYGQSKGWLAGEAGYILRTTNAGTKWDSLNSDTQVDLYSLHFVNENTGYVSGYNGMILKTTNGGGAGTPIGISTQSVTAEDFYLGQNFPNPFNPSTKISYKLLTASYIDLSVHDMSGRLVSKLVSDKQSAGSYQVEFSSEGLPSGVYFYSLEVDGIVIGVKKMLALK
jgi:photosystem II stability/assembly factor-like uncharacterized protein